MCIVYQNNSRLQADSYETTLVVFRFCSIAPLGQEKNPFLGKKYFPDSITNSSLTVCHLYDDLCFYDLFSGLIDFDVLFNIKQYRKYIFHFFTWEQLLLSSDNLFDGSIASCNFYYTTSTTVWVMYSKFCTSICKFYINLNLEWLIWFLQVAWLILKNLVH